MLDGLLLLCIFFGPWWTTLALGVFLLIFAGAYEAILFGFWWDTLYGAPVEAFFQIEYIMTVLFIICALLGLFLRSTIRIR